MSLLSQSMLLEQYVFSNYLVKNKYVGSGKVVLNGGSNGGKIAYIYSKCQGGFTTFQVSSSLDL